LFSGNDYHNTTASKDVVGKWKNARILAELYKKFSPFLAAETIAVIALVPGGFHGIELPAKEPHKCLNNIGKLKSAWVLYNTVSSA
jgi:hypothetical protein